MQGKIGNAVIVTGRAGRDATLKTVGDRGTKIADWSILADKREDDTAVFVNCKAFYELAEYAAQIRKGDAVLAVGRIEEREYNGKTYKDVVCDFVSVSSAANAPAQYEGGSGFAPMDGGGDSDLPF